MYSIYISVIRVSMCYVNYCASLHASTACKKKPYAGSACFLVKLYRGCPVVGSDRRYENFVDASKDVSSVWCVALSSLSKLWL